MDSNTEIGTTNNTQEDSEMKITETETTTTTTNRNEEKHEMTDPNTIQLEEEKMEQNEMDMLAMTSDGTAIQNFRVVDNTRYSREIIESARASFDLDKLEALRGQANLEEFYTEGKKQILEMYSADQSLGTHTALFQVQLQINVGKILNRIEPTFKKKGAYMKWLRENFKDKHLRYFQQAKQLALMGDFADEYAAVGKNRLLALDHLKVVENRTDCVALFADHPLPDVTEDEEKGSWKSHIDSVITLHRLRNAGVQIATFDQATKIASCNNEALSVRKATEIKNWLDQYPEDQRPALLDRFIQGHLHYPSENPYTPASKANLEKVLADLLNCSSTENLDDDTWIAEQRQVLNMQSLIEAQRLIGQLIERLRTVEVTQEPQVPSADETRAA